jgi:hypothetical protein
MKLKAHLALCVLVSASALVTPPRAFAQASFTGTYTQNFSSMGTGTTVPIGWSGVSEAGSHYTFEPAGDYNGTGTATVSANPNLSTGTLTASPVEYLVPTQGSSTGKGADIVNFQNTQATTQNGEGSESLGTDPSGNAATILELALKNTTGQAINAVNIAYDIDRFTTISDTNGVPAGYPNSSVEEFPGYQLFYNLTTSGSSVDGFNPNDWVNVASLNPTINMGTTAGAVNVPNTVGVTSVPTTTINLASAWAAGATIGFAWLDDNGQAPSPDQEIGLNNVVIQAVPEPRSFLLGLVAVGAVVTLLRLRRQRAA